jgi:hypothetical protein
METPDAYIKRADEAREKEHQRRMKKRFNAHIKETLRTEAPKQQEAEERQREENPEQPDYRPQPAKPMRPLPIN